MESRGPGPLNNSVLLLFEGFVMNLAILGLWKFRACGTVVLVIARSTPYIPELAYFALESRAT
jgi:hypothetical protein